MKTTFKVSYYLRSNYENKEGKSPVMLRMYLGGQMANLGSTKIFVDKSKWSNKTSRMIGRTAEALSVNASIDALTTTLMQIYRKYETSESLSLDLIRSVFLGTDKEFTTFLPVFDYRRLWRFYHIFNFFKRKSVTFTKRACFIRSFVYCRQCLPWNFNGACWIAPYRIRDFLRLQINLYSIYFAKYCGFPKKVCKMIEF